MAKIRDVNDVIAELNRVNTRVETLLRQLPTDDHHKISELFQLVNRLDFLMDVETTKEAGTMFLERSRRIGQFLKREYLNAQFDGMLRKERKDS